MPSPETFGDLGNAAPPVQTSATDNSRVSSKGANDVVSPLLSLLHHPDRIVRRDAIRSLARLGPSGAGAAPGLVGCLADQDPDVRRAARIAILQVDPKAEVLLDALRNADPTIRKSAMAAMPRLPKLNPPPVDALIAHLPVEDPEVGQGIVDALVNIGIGFIGRTSRGSPSPLPEPDFIFNRWEPGSRGGVGRRLHKVR